MPCSKDEKDVLSASNRNEYFLVPIDHHRHKPAVNEEDEAGLLIVMIGIEISLETR